MFSQMAEPVRDLSSGPGLIVRTGSSYYRVRGSPGSEIAPCPALATVPEAPYWLLGIGLHKDEAAPVIHLQALLAGHSLNTAGASRILLMRDSGRPVAYLVDDVEPDEGQTEATELDLPGVGRVLISHSFIAKNNSEY